MKEGNLHLLRVGESDLHMGWGSGGWGCVWGQWQQIESYSSFHCHPSAEAGLWLVQEKEAGMRLVEAEREVVFFFHNEPFLCIGSSPGEGRGQKDHPILLLSSTLGQVQAWGWKDG